MPYNPNVPVSSEDISNTQNTILNNFINIDSIIDVNHYSFGTANEGNHKFVIMPEVVTGGNPPAPVTGVNQGALWVGVGGTSFLSELFWGPEQGAAARPITEGLRNTTTTGNGWAFFGNGTLVKWGTFTLVSNGDPTTSILATFPTGAGLRAFVTPPKVFVHPYAAQGVVIVNVSGSPAPTVTEFHVTTNAASGNFTFNYLAIGT